MNKAKFGLGIATGTEGLMYPIPYSSVREVIETSKYAEELGFDSVWGNDHISTQKYVGAEFDQPPRYYSPLITLAAIAENTNKLRIATGLLVVPFRNPVVLAKEVATLDHISEGRMLLAVGIGAYREEFEAEFGKDASKVNRGEMLDESVEIMHLLFNEDWVNYNGKYFSINNAQSYPKPIQSPLPILFGGNSPNGYRRVGKWGSGWLPAMLTPQEVEFGCDSIREQCFKFSRNFDLLMIAPQFAVSIARTHERAVVRFESSQIYRHSISLAQSTLKGKNPENYAGRNLIGSVDEVIEQVDNYIRAGVNVFSALIFADKTLTETREHMHLFAEEIISRFS